MLDLSLHGITLRGVTGVSLNFARSTHTAIAGPPACGASTLLRIIAGEEKPARGRVEIGTRDVTKLATSRRPLLYVTSTIDAPMRWSVEHALVNAVRGRTLDRIDRHLEIQHAATKWNIATLLDRTIGSLSDHERAQVHLARIELRKPAIVVADKLLRDAPDLADEWYRTLRVIGATVISAPASVTELGYTDRVIVLDRGRVVQEGSAAQIYASPNSEASAIATGDVNVIPIVIARGVVESPIGSWESNAFEGAGVALARPSDFSVAKAGEDSDLIFGIEEAAFAGGRWLARGFITGAFVLRVELPREVAVQKGKLLALRYDAARFKLLSTRLATAESV